MFAKCSIAMPTRSTPQKKIDDRAFPVRVKFRVPQRGFGQSYTEMYDWLNTKVGFGGYAKHSEGHAAAFYFLDVETAQHFIAAFPQLELADGTLSRTYSSPAMDAAVDAGELLGVCNLYSITKGQAAIRELFDGITDATGNLQPLPKVYPDYHAPVVANMEGGRVLTMMRWGMPSPTFALQGKRTDRGVTNIRNTKSPHWRRWLGEAHRCVVPFDAFSEPHNAPGKPSEPVWFALDETRPLAFFAGVWTRWTSVRKLKDGETTDNLFGFLTTDANAVVAEVHPKAMPVVLTSMDEVETWLTAPVDEALALQRPLADGRLLRVSEVGNSQQ